MEELLWMILIGKRGVQYMQLGPQPMHLEGINRTALSVVRSMAAVGLNGSTQSAGAPRLKAVCTVS